MGDRPSTATDPASVKPAEFQILLALADGQRHGYGIMQEVEQRTGGAVRLGPGTLYGAIKRLRASGLIEESPNRPPAKRDDERRRCYYRLTRSGHRAATAEAERLAALVRAAAEKRLIKLSDLITATGGGT